MLAVLAVVVTVCALVWWLMTVVPPDLPPNSESLEAIDNVHHWMRYMMGSRWPVILAIITALLVAVLIAIASAGTTLNVDPQTLSILARLVAVMTVAIVVNLTWRMKSDFDNRKIEFAIILLLISLNSYLIYRMGSV